MKKPRTFLRTKVYAHNQWPGLALVCEECGMVFAGRMVYLGAATHTCKPLARYSPLATDLTAREVSSQRTEAARDFH